MKQTGLGSWMAACSSPLASSAVDGATTLIPGECMNSASGFWEWNGPAGEAAAATAAAP